MKEKEKLDAQKRPTLQNQTELKTKDKIEKYELDYDRVKHEDKFVPMAKNEVYVAEEVGKKKPKI